YGRRRRPKEDAIVPESTSAGKGSALSRRELLKRASALGVATVVPGSVLAEDAVAAKTTVVHSDALETFSPAQADTVDAIVGRLVPNDAVGPGAVEAGVTQYIDHSLASALQSNANDYTNGLAATDAAATRTYGTTFAKLTDAQKDALLTQMQANTVTGFSPDSRTFFNLIREHSLQ